MQHYELKIRLGEIVWAQTLLQHLPLPEWVHAGCLLPWLILRLLKQEIKRAGEESVVIHLPLPRLACKPGFLSG